ncbi:LPXTG cell wall anchor domain-containing protein [Enterococcus casseliflavus]|uniref:MucBP domain-containing protein n=1 Tax=Enterococcus casseliflavus TaxID=37734 RepID=UPI00143333D6|nr:LPXTG cell wall anchor domain-containing protein [Enterococcus casseliflavus]
MKNKFKSILSLVILLSAAVVTPAFQVVAESQVFSESPQVDQEEVKTVQSDDTNASADAGQATSQVENPTLTTTTSARLDAENEQTQASSDSKEAISGSENKEEPAVDTVNNVPSSVDPSSARAANAQLTVQVLDSNSNQPIQGAYFTLTSSTSGEVTLLVTDSSGKVTIQVPSGGYFIKQVGTTNQRLNYAFTSIGNSINLQAGETKTLALYERQIVGEYAFGDSPDTIHIPVNSNFDFSTQALGIEAFKLNFSGNIEKSISDSQIFPYYTNVDPSKPGTYVAIFMARQASYSVYTTHVVNVIVDPEQVGEVTVRYLNTQGQEIHETKTLSGTIGASYDASTDEYKLSIDGYTLDESQLPENSKGIFSETAQTVTYIYKKNPIPAADVTVEYVDTESNEIHASQTINGNLGDSYDASTDQYKLSIDGYTLDESQLPENSKGVFGETAQTVTYIYTENPIPAADVTIEYVDLEGNEIHASQTISGNVGDSFDASADQYKLSIDGYTLDKSQLPENSKGTFSEKAQTVTYIYTKNPIPAADVTVEYVDTEGNEIHASQTISGNVGDSFDTSTDQYKLSIDGYTLDESQLPKNSKGVFSETAQTVTYIYTKNSIPAADVTVEYVDTEGNEIHASQKINGNLGDSYDASTDQYKLSIDGYTLDESQLPENSKGIFSETQQIITYIYKKNPIPAADVTVEYVDTEGNEIHAAEKISGNVGDTYDASTDQYKLSIDGYTLDESQLPENLKGVFSETAQTITYVYTKNPIPAADVTVEYVDTEGEEIHSPQTISGNVGDSYDASTEKYQLKIEGYTLDQSQLPENSKGMFSETAQTITYIYKKNPVPAADVTVEYVDTEGNEIHASQKISGNVGESYDASTDQYKLSIDGYTLDESQLPENSKGVFSETAQTITYIYTKNPIPAADVTVEYVDTEGNEIHASQTISGNVGESYDASTKNYQLVIEGYTLDESQLPENSKGMFSETAQTITYVYTKNPIPAADVTVEYVDTEGEEIHSPQTISGNVGESYDASTEQYQLKIDGYTIDKSQLPENSKGTFSEKAQTVTYIYTKNPIPAADVTVEYADTEGNEIHAPQTISGNVGDSFDVSTDQYKLSIDGYTLDESQLPENSKGVFSETAQTVTYIYTKNPIPAADVTIEYVDIEGNEIHPSQTISGNVGESYDASTEKYQLTIDGYTLDKSQLPENSKDTFSEKAQTVTYIYTKNPVPAADVTIEYVDLEGNEIHSSQTISGNMGDSYDTSTEQYKLSIDGYTLDESQLPENSKGAFSETAQTVTYIYTKNPIPAADITVEYVDTEGKEIHPSQTISGNVGESYDASTKKYQLTIDGYIVDESRLPQNAKGTFGKEEATVTYVYTKENAATVVISDKKEKEPTATVVSKKSASAQRLPQTDEQGTLFPFVVGLFFIATASWLYFKKRK